MKKAKLTILILVCLIFSGIKSPEAQVVFGQRSSATLGAIYQSWDLKKKTETITLTQWAVPFELFVPLRENLELRIYSSGTSVGLKEKKIDTYLREINDTKVEVAGSFLDDRYLLSLGANIPSGKSSLKGIEIEIASYLFLDYLNFPIKNLGEGLNLNLNLIRAFQCDKFIWGAGVGYQYSGTYQPYSDLSDYKPGDKAYLTGGFSLNTGKTKISGDVTYGIYQKDKQDKKEIFKDGNQLDLKGKLLYDYQRLALKVFARVLLRAKDQRYGTAKIHLEEAKNHGNDFRFSTSLSYRVTSKVSLSGQVEAKYVQANDYHPSHTLHRGRSYVLQDVSG